MKQRNIKITCTKKTKLKYLGALSRVRLYYPPASGGIELTQERGILGGIYIGKIKQIIIERFRLQNKSKMRLIKNIVLNLIQLI